MMRYAMLGSGSRGNGTLVTVGDTRILVDCGFRLDETERRLAQRGIAPASLTAIVVTHEHGDHLGGVASLARRYDIPVWLTAGTLDVWGKAVPRMNIVNPHQRFVIGDTEIEPYPVPHDAREPCQYVFSDGRSRLGLLSDAGTVTPHIRAMLSGCHALLLEANHDAGLLFDGPYPPSLKKRVGGAYGHLSNAQSAELLSSIDCSRLKQLVLIHLSETNNSPARARAAIVSALGCDPDWLVCADQNLGLDWYEIG
jgi:phosphoribosyl 1,2-cyclic phosphodiesterase